MCWYEIDIEPRDVLFFRDAKPMEASSIGAGAKWPLPNILHDAFMSALHYKWPERQGWEFEHQHKTEKEKKSKSSMRFGGVHSVGVFPVFNGELHFPKPADISNAGDDIATLQKQEGESNLPDFLEYVFLNNGEKTKESAGEWISASEMVNYLNGNVPQQLVKTSEIYDIESRIGIGIDAETKTTEEGAFYIAEYMRLKPESLIKGFVCGKSSIRGDKETDILEKYFEESKNEHIIFGGQRGIVYASGKREEKPLPFTSLDNSSKNGTIVKWILLSPAIFMSGWLPGWIGEEGNVCLPAEKPERKSGESRQDWRARFGAPLKAKLIAARVDKPQIFSGWNLRKGGPRATMSVVPAGSVYYFRAESVEDAQALAKTLQGHCKSDFYGEKGFGFGIATIMEDNINKVD